MNRNVFTPGAIEQSVRELDTFRNDILGVAAFGFGLAALQFNRDASAIATISLLFIFLWGMVKVLPRKGDHDRVYDGMSFVRRNIVPIIRNPVLAIGLTFLLFVATGFLTLDRLAWFSLARFFVR